MGGNPETLTNAAGVVVFEGTTSESGGTQPLEVTFTAAQVAARYDADLGIACLALTDLGVDDVVLGYYETANDLDTGSPGSTAIFAYLPGASTPDVFNNGEAVSAGLTDTPGTYQRALTYGSGFTIGQLLAGATAYAEVGCGTSPATGSVTLRILLAV